MTNEQSDFISRALTWVVIGVAGIIAIRLAIFVLGLATFVIFRVGPMLLVAYVLYRVYRHLTRPAEER